MLKNTSLMLLMWKQDRGFKDDKKLAQLFLVTPLGNVIDDRLQHAEAVTPSTSNIEPNKRLRQQYEDGPVDLICTAFKS